MKGDEKEKMDTTDSSQDSLVKSEAEDEPDKKEDGKAVKEDKSDEKSDEKSNENSKQNDSDNKKEKNDIDGNKNSNKDVKKEEKDDGSDEDEEEEEEDDEDDDKKDVPLLDQPLEQTGTRDRKKVQRFNEDMPVDKEVCFSNRRIVIIIINRSFYFCSCRKSIFQKDPAPSSAIFPASMLPYRGSKPTISNSCTKSCSKCPAKRSR